MDVSGPKVANVIGKLANTCSKTNMVRPLTTSAEKHSHLTRCSSPCAQGWWTFQICHLDEIKQWHEDNGVVQKDASWSIGKIDVPKDLGAFKVHETTGQAALVQHDFDGGQMCHEIKQPRSGPSACAECPLPSALAPI